ncbi:ketopantoate reductase family protein [Paenibacillus caseinilyticus]|nr:2-dehydropantoate 2-reductase [Paenibacillus mucilaginosus]
MRMKAKVTIVGAGSLGMLFGGRLAAAGVAVELVVRRPEQGRRLEAEGLTLGVAGGGAQAPLHVRPAVRLLEGSDGPDRGAAPGGHWVLLTVKQTAVTPGFAEALRRLLPEDAVLVCLQNGIGHAEVLAEAFPLQRLLLAVTTEGALKQTDTEALHTGKGTTWIGAAAGEGGSALSVQKNLAALLERAGFRAEVSNNIQQRVWQKLLMNAVINPLTAILQVPNGELPLLPGVPQLMRELLGEGEELARRLGIPLDPGLWEQVLSVCRATAANRSSMLQDVLAGRPTEIGAINGGLLREAQRLDVRLPVNETLYTLVRALEEKGRHTRGQPATMPIESGDED